MLKYDDHIGDNDLINLKIVAVFAAVLGHIFPIFAGFRGGKGVATLVGAVTGIYPPVALLCFGVWFIMLMIFHYVSLASMVAGCCFPLFTLISPKVNGSIPFVVFSFVIAILLIYTHRKNIERLKTGTESKIYVWKPRRVKIPSTGAKARECGTTAEKRRMRPGGAGGTASRRMRTKPARNTPRRKITVRKQQPNTYNMLEENLIKIYEKSFRENRGRCRP